MKIHTPQPLEIIGPSLHVAGASNALVECDQ